eukprot:2960894-Rhodomonas_salina.1
MRAVDRLGSTTGSPRPCDAGAVGCRGRTCSMPLRLYDAMSGTDMRTVAVLVLAHRADTHSRSRSLA